MQASIPKRLQFRSQVRDLIPIGLIQPPCSNLSNGNKPAFEQHSQVLGNRGPCQREVGRDLAGRSLLIPNHRQDLSPGPICQCAQGGVHNVKSVSIFLRKRQVTLRPHVPGFLVHKTRQVSFVEQRVLKQSVRRVSARVSTKQS